MKEDLIKKIVVLKQKVIDTLMEEFDDNIYMVAFILFMLGLVGLVFLFSLLALFFVAPIAPLILIGLGIIYFALVKYLKKTGGK